MKRPYRVQTYHQTEHADWRTVKIPAVQEHPQAKEPMLYYPKIPGPAEAPLARCTAFEKYDGTNLHWTWDRDHGWHAFGTRREEYNWTSEGRAAFTEQHDHLREALTIFQETLADGLGRIFRNHQRYSVWQELRAYTEFLGPNSFAGRHKAGELKELRLFDVAATPFGFIGPEQFTADFSALPSAKVVYIGRFTGKLTADVREGKYPVTEGVVCKGGAGPTRWAVKVKTDAYMAKLKQAFADQWEQYWE